MSTATEEFFELMVRFGECERLTIAETEQFAERKFTGRMLRLRDCPILSTNLKGEGQLSRGDEIEIGITEGDADQQVIGSFDSLSYLQLSLPPVTFADFWAASAAADGAARNVTIHFKSDASRYFRVTRVALVEYMPTPIDDNPKARKRAFPIRQHPVVTELREMQRRLVGSWHGLLIAAGFIFGISILTAILRVIWQFIQQQQ